MILRAIKKASSVGAVYVGAVVGTTGLILTNAVYLAGQKKNELREKLSKNK